MEKISAREIESWTEGSLASGSLESTVYSVCTDSRQVEEGALFVPIKGEHFDAHMFINDSFNAGASICLADSPYEISDTNCTVIRVSNTLKALQDIAKNYRKRFDVPIIGITGSVGKTTTKEMVAAALGETLNVLKTEGNYNGQLGLPLTLLRLEAWHQAAVVEMGISEFGEMERLAEIASADIGVITNIGISHIQNFKTVENICHEKLKILKDGIGKYYLNGDSPQLSEIHNQNLANATYFGLNGSYPYRAEDICTNGEYTEFVLVTEGLKENITIPCLGMHNVYNALAAIAVASDMGVHPDDIKSGLMNYQGMSMRQQISHFNDITLIDDSYNASPDSVKSSISVMRSLPSNGKNIVVMSDMLELGEKSGDIHFELGRYMALEGIDILITIGQMSEHLSRGAVESGKKIDTIHCKSNTEASNELLSRISEGDKILVKGSRGMHTEEIVKYIKNLVIDKNSIDETT